MSKLCVFTPTYNRAYILPQLYTSLKKQTCSDFTWLIVDDGSTDDTETVVKNFLNESQVDITYLKTSNGGKQRAINVGVQNCQDELFFCVDSDDYLVPTAVEHILSMWDTVKKDPTICGIVALRGTDETHPMVTWMPQGLTRTKYWDLFETHGFRGDTSLIHRTDILRIYPYEVADNEKFIGETAVYYRLDDNYNHAIDNTILTICNYREDGYSRNIWNIIAANPVGYWKLKQYNSSRAKKLKNQFKETLFYEIGCLLADKRIIIRDAPHKIIASIMRLPASIIYSLFFHLPKKSKAFARLRSFISKPLINLPERKEHK